MIEKGNPGAPFLIGQCDGCRRQMYPVSIWRKMSEAERAATGAVGEYADGICGKCTRSPHLRDPEPGAPYEDPTCSDCGKELVSPGQWRKASEVERQELLEEGYVRERRDGLCRGCSDPAPVKHRWPLVRRKPGEALRLYVEYRKAGMTSTPEIARKIGITAEGLNKALRKARAAGQELP